MTTFLSPGAYLPHQAPMILLDNVIEVTKERARCQVTVSHDSVLSPFVDANGELPAWYALELMAQTVGVWSGWHRMMQGESAIALGMVLGARDLKCELSAFPAASVLEIEVNLLMQDEKFGSFEAVIRHADRRLASGRVNTFQPDAGQLAQLFNQEALP